MDSSANLARNKFIRQNAATALQLFLFGKFDRGGGFRDFEWRTFATRSAFADGKTKTPSFKI